MECNARTVQFEYSRNINYLFEVRNRNYNYLMTALYKFETVHVHIQEAYKNARKVKTFYLKLPNNLLTNLFSYLYKLYYSVYKCHSVTVKFLALPSGSDSLLPFHKLIIISLPRSATAITGALVFPTGTLGITEASITLSPVTPITRS